MGTDSRSVLFGRQSCDLQPQDADIQERVEEVVPKHAAAKFLGRQTDSACLEL